MTYCLAATCDQGLVFVSDSRTNAGIDQLGTFSKMHPFTDLPGRFFTLLSAGNLATTQAVVARLRSDLREGAKTSLATVERLRDAALYIGNINREVQARHPEEERPAGFSPEADFIFGGQIGDAPHDLFHIYTAGNFYAPTDLAPFLQIGEQKYGKPILDRILKTDTPLETVARCGLVSMDSTMRSNGSVGPPIELMIYRAGNAGSSTHMVYDEDNPYLRVLRKAWADNLTQAFENLPPIELPQPKFRAVET
ncbi:MAG: 20S proteasome subunit A/B [Xanthomonadales bacterium]|jgi:putative proteasome-type protease|nr:20S proteasome subunit A/B [Xanthomonadales bacterium]